MTSTPITAADLKPGDIVLNGITGEREHAAFDVEQHEHVVLVWTATSDHERGVAELLTYESTTSLLVARR